jgi:hypothetical protein
MTTTPNFDQLQEAVREARTLRSLAERFANTFAELLADHLREVSSYRLKKLKTQLRDFNACTGRWTR